VCRLKTVSVPVVERSVPIVECGVPAVERSVPAAECSCSVSAVLYSDFW